MKVEAYDRNVSQLLGMGYFRVPRFQRPYSWEKSEVEDFWNDTIEESEGDYFIGSIVLFRDAPDVFGVVDGQQRLTTITMVLCGLRNLLSQHGHADLASGLHQLVERPDISNKKQYVIQTETSYPFFQERIQRAPQSNDESSQPGDEEGRLRDAFDYILTRLRENVDSLSGKTRQAVGKIKKRIQERLLDIRDRILRLKVIVITLDSEEDAYTIFETLNTRGKDLTVGDLVRTHLTRLIPQGNKNVDRPKERFNDIIDRFERSEAEISINSFLHHYWLSGYDYTTEKKLYKAVRKHVKNRDQASKFLKSLESDSQLYRVIYEPSSKRWRSEEQDLKDSLQSLVVFRVRQPIPFVLAVLCEYENGRLPLKHAKRSLRAVENFHFQFTAVTSQRSSGGISFMYALHARKLRNSRSLGERIKGINELTEKLKDKLPPYEEYEANFCEIGVSEKLTKRKALVQYILYRMASTFMRDVAIDWGRMTIEHIAPQSGGSGTELTDDQVAEIGNLIFVSEKLNSRLDRKDFLKKLAILRRANIWTDDCLKGQTAWGPAQIRERSKHLARLAYEKVWRV